MHSIERYGIVALIFLVVTVVAVLLWDSGAKKKAGQEAAPTVLTEPETSRADAEDTLDADEGSTLRMGAQAGPRPLLRQELSAEPLRERASEREDTAALEAPERGPAARGPVVAPAGLVPASAPRVAPAASAPRDSQPARAARSELPITPAPAGARYVVRASDTLSEIAQRELGSSRRWPEIQAANPGLNPARLRVGQTLVLPAGARSATPVTAAAARESAPPPKNAAPAAAGARATWKVGAGESLWKIAERTLGNGKRWREIAALNPAIDPDKLVVGTLIAVPSKESATRGKPIVASASLEAPSRESRARPAPKAAAPASGGKVR